MLRRGDDNLEEPKEWSWGGWPPQQSHAQCLHYVCLLEKTSKITWSNHPPTTNVTH